MRVPRALIAILLAVVVACALEPVASRAHAQKNEPVLLQVLGKATGRLRARDTSKTLPTHEERVGQTGKLPSFSLPLATKLNSNAELYIPPDEFGASRWDPVQGGPGPFGPSSSFASSTVAAGQTPPAPPGIKPEDNPMLYILRPGAAPAAQQQQEPQALNPSSFVETRATTDPPPAPMGQLVKSQPGWVLTLATKLNDNTKLYISPESFGNSKWSVRDGMPEGEHPDKKMSHEFIPLGATHPYAPGTPSAKNPNAYTQPPPIGVASGITEEVMRGLREDKRLNAQDEEVGASRAAQMAFNKFPSEAPFYTNSPAPADNGGLPAQVNRPEIHIGAVENNIKPGPLQ